VAIYHVVTRIVDRRFALETEQKKRLKCQTIYRRKIKGGMFSLQKNWPWMVTKYSIEK